MDDNEWIKKTKYITKRNPFQLEGGLKLLEIQSSQTDVQD